MAEDIPYIGSRISLISKSDIRYEGVLFTIDMEQSSIALKDVVSHGTEGRRLHGPQVPPSGEVYEYIIFKGDDIKDLTVLGPSAPPASTPMNDPAVLSVGAYGAPPPAPPAPAYQAPNAWGAPPAAPAPQPQYASLYGDSQWGPPAGPAPPAPQPPPRSAQVAPQVQIAPAGQPPRPAQPPPKPTNYAMAAGARPTAGPGGRGPSGPPAGGRGGPAPYGGRGGQGGYHATLPGSGGRGMGGGRGPAPPSRPPPPPAPAPIPVPSEDFNFELQNAKFNKDELVKELKVEKAGKKVDDFFDEISCEAVERLTLDTAAMPRDGRSRAADARRLDIETFGGMGNVQRHYGGGPGGRGGRGGRGGPNGRGGRGEGRGGSGRGGLRPNATGVPVGAGGGGGRGNRY